MGWSDLRLDQVITPDNNTHEKARTDRNEGARTEEPIESFQSSVLYFLLYKIYQETMGNLCDLYLLYCKLEDSLQKPGKVSWVPI